MLPFEDQRWESLQGGYRATYDPRPALTRLEREPMNEEVWDELWQELHHQGDVGPASYAAVPHLFRILQKQPPQPYWAFYGLPSCIELARLRGDNPPIPQWLREGYDAAVQGLGAMALKELATPSNPELLHSTLAILLLARGETALARLVFDFTKDELEELLNEYEG